MSDLRLVNGTTSGIDTLPQELIDMIIDELAASDTCLALKSCTLVCRSFLPRARMHLFDTVFLRKRRPATMVPITSAVSTSTLSLVKSLNINFSPAEPPTFGVPRPSIGSTEGFPTSLDAFTSLESLVMMHLSWERVNSCSDALLAGLKRGPHTFKTLMLTAMQFAGLSDVCSLVRASPNLKNLSCVGVHVLDGACQCDELHAWDQVERLIMFPGTFRLFSVGSASGEDDYKLLRAILDPRQCPKALPRLDTITFWMDMIYMHLFDDLLEMTRDTVRTLNMIFPSLPGATRLHLKHLTSLRLDLSEWDGLSSDPMSEATQSIFRLRDYLDQDPHYRLEHIDIWLSRSIVLCGTTASEAWVALFETLGDAVRFADLKSVHLKFTTAVDMEYMLKQMEGKDMFARLARNGVATDNSLLAA